jgi:4-hydroxybenzoate polyprenyltransferase
MKLIPAFFRLIRWPNLVFIVLTQALFYYCILLPVFNDYNAEPSLSQQFFWLMVAASVLIAAAGYIINDYFDINIDRVNKPGRMVVDKVIKRRWAIVWHLVLSAAGILLSLLVSLQTRDWFVFMAGAINTICVGALWLYSTTFKRKLLIGNVIISLLTAWTILVLYLCNLQSLRFTQVLLQAKYDYNYNLASAKLFKLAILYAGFAFIISLIREVVKDMEDMEGDARYNCRTMPIAWGIPVSKVFTGVWLVVLVAILSIVQFYVLQLGWWLSAVYCFVLIVLPLLWLLYKLYKAQVTADYRLLSTVIKAIMFTGILSMMFFYFYH